MRDRIIEALKLVLGAEGWKVFMADAIGAILDPYQRANPNLTVEGVILLLLRDGRPEDAKRVQESLGRMFPVPKATS